MVLRLVKMATSRVEGFASLTREQFRRLTKEQLVAIAEAEDVELEEGMKKPAIVTHLIGVLELEGIWQEQRQRQEREAERVRELAALERQKELAALERQKELAALERQRELEALERQREVEKQQERTAERAHREKMAALEMDKLIARKSEKGFDMAKARGFMPPFEEDSVDVFFEMFEKVAKESEWPEAKWPLLVQSVLRGKAQRAMAALDCRLGLDYDSLRKAVLQAYGSVPEAYRIKFRELRRQPNESHLDLWRKQEVAFDRWINANEAFNYQSLRDLILLEQFKASVSKEIETHLNEREVESPQQAAELADNYEVTHSRRRPREEKVGESQQRGFGGGVSWRPHGADHSVPPRHERPLSRPPGRFQPSGRGSGPPSKMRCFRCNKLGHKKSQCNSQGTRSGGFVALVSTEPDLTGELQGYEGFVSKGAVSESQEESPVPITILRDTGATQTLLQKGVLKLGNSTFTGRFTVVRGIGSGYENAPLHRIYLYSDLVSKYVTVAEVGSLPLVGIDLLLGNDVAGTRVTPVVLEEPSESVEVQELEAEFPEVFTACVVTRSQAQKEVAQKQELGCHPPSGSEEMCINLSDTVFPQLSSSRITEESREPVREQGEAGLVQPEASVVHEVSTLSGSETGQDQVAESDTDAPSLGGGTPSMDSQALAKAQKEDPSLEYAFKVASSAEESKDVGTGYFIRDGLLFRKWRPADRPAGEDWASYEQVVLPQGHRTDVLHLAHEASYGGHLGFRKTLDRVSRHFYWPSLRKDVKRFCRSCHVCQVVGKARSAPPVAPLQPLPIVREPFSEIMIDCVGPLPKTKRGNEYLLTIMDTATRYPEAFPLRSIRAKVIAEHLIKFFSWAGLPRSIQSDRGSNFTSKLYHQVMSELRITLKHSSPYHPQSQGVIERFHGTLKTMIRAFVESQPKEWDEAIPFLMFAIRDAPTESLGFSPFELVFGHEVRGPLKLLKERIVEPTAPEDVLQYVSSCRTRLQAACEVACKNLAGAKARMKARYDQKAVQRVFDPGDLVLVLVSGAREQLSPGFAGPYRVLRRVGNLNYVLSTPDRRTKTRFCHINTLKAYEGRESDAVVCCTASEFPEEGEETDAGYSPPEIVSARLYNTQALEVLSEQLGHLDEPQQQDVHQLVEEHPKLFRDVPGRTTKAVHDVDTGVAAPVKQHPYRFPPHKKLTVQEEVDYMLQIGVIELSDSPWSSPVVLAAQEGRPDRFCVDFRKVNQATKGDAFPHPPPRRLYRPG